MAPQRRHLPCALTIAGSDSGGGAGVQADLKTFAALRVHGTCALTCITAQNPDGVRAVQPVRSSVVRAQIDAVCQSMRPSSIKIGMLCSGPVVAAVADALEEYPAIPLVVDPVLVATSGARLLDSAGVALLVRKLLPRATLITPNRHEAGRLLQRPLRSLGQLRSAARELHRRFGCAALVKGGHFRRLPTAADFYFDGEQELLLETPWIRGATTHGTGCTLSAAVAAFLARGHGLPRAVKLAKNYVANAIAKSAFVGPYAVLGAPLG